MRVHDARDRIKSEAEGSKLRLDPNAWLQIVAGLIVPILCLLLAAILWGCAPENDTPGPAGEPEPRYGGTLRFLHEETGTLDPVYIDDVYEGAILARIYEGLVRLDGNLGVRPSLAQSWVVSEDGTLYTLVLRPGVNFHDGRPLTADIVIQSLQRAVDPNSLGSTYLRGIEGAEDFQEGRADHLRGLQALGRDTVQVRLSEPLSFFLSALCMDQLRITPPMDGTWDPNATPLGTGPFRFVRMTEDGSIYLARNEEYWGRPAYVDSLQFIVGTEMSEEETIAAMLRREAHIMEAGGREEEILRDKAGYRVFRCPDISVTFFGLNTQVPPFDRVEVRQALAMAVNRDSLVGQGSPWFDVATGILPPRMAGYKPEPKILPHDAERARQVLAEAGFGPDNPVPTVQFYTNDTGSETFEKELVRELEEVGIPMEYHLMSWPALDSQINQRQAPLFTLTWVADVLDPDAFLWFLFRTGEPNNLFEFSDAEVDSLLLLGRRTPPGPERFALYRRIEARVLQLAPMIPLFHGSSYYVVDPRLRGLEVSPFGFYYSNFADVWFAQEETLASQLKAGGGP